jgi:hypothetical protein
MADAQSGGLANVDTVPQLQMEQAGGIRGCRASRQIVTGVVVIGVVSQSVAQGNLCVGDWKLFSEVGILPKHGAGDREQDFAFPQSVDGRGRNRGSEADDSPNGNFSDDKHLHSADELEGATISCNLSLVGVASRAFDASLR